MRKHVAIAVVSLLVSSLELRSEANLPRVLQLFGHVTAAAQPVDDAMIVAFGLKNFASHQAVSDASGAFRLPALPTDVYRLIAVKRGFAPAVATVVPSSADMRVQIRLKEGKATAESANQIWEIRRSLPADVLRELDAVMEDAQPADELDRFRFGGEMESLTGVTNPRTGSDSTQAALALRGSSASGWSVDITGRLQQFDGPTANLGRSAQSSGIVMALQTSPDQSVRIASSRNWMRIDQEADQQVDFESHRIEWSRPDTNVEVRYQSQQNLYLSPLLNSAVLQVAGRRSLLHSDRSHLDVQVNVWQENLPQGATGTPAYRVANLGTAGSFAPIDAIDLRYGLRTRITDSGQQWTPETGAQLSLTPRTSLVVAGLYTVGERLTDFTAPMLTSSADLSSITPRYRYSLGLVSGDKKGNELSAIVTVAAIDSMMSMLFDDGATSSGTWDGYLLAAGDVHRDLTVTWRRNLGDRLYLDVTTTAAQTESSELLADVTRHYVASHVRSLYRPSGTSVEVTYRMVEQPDSEVSPVDTSGERLNVRLGQSLHLPLDLRLLVGVDLARDNGGPLPDDLLQRRYLGGISLAF